MLAERGAGEADEGVAEGAGAARRARVISDADPDARFFSSCAPFAFVFASPGLTASSRADAGAV